MTSSAALLPPRSRIVVRAVAEAMFAEDGEVSAERLDAHVDDVERFLGGASAPVRFGLALALFVLRLSPLLLLRHLTLLDRLPVNARVSVLDRVERSRLMPLCLAFVGWRTIATLVFYEDPRELAALGYPGDERARYKRRLPIQAPVPAESGFRLRDRVLPVSLRVLNEGPAEEVA